jgi:hypothetical protein
MKNVRNPKKNYVETLDRKTEIWYNKENMDFNFKKFEHTNQRFEDRITVTGTSSFGFPTKFFKDHNIASYKYVVIFYDADKKAVGLHFTNSEEEKHKYTILKSKVGYGGSVIATSFFKTYNINPKTYQGRYEWEKKEIPEAGTLFVIVLKERVVKEKDKPQINTETSIDQAQGGVPERP